MGSISAHDPDSRPVYIRAEAAARVDIETVDIVRNGETLRSFPVNDWHCAIGCAEHDDPAGLRMPSNHIGDFVYYYVRVTCTNGAQAWSSPVWLTGA